MNGHTNLNQSITAAWSVPAVASSSTTTLNGNPPLAAGNSGVKRRVKRTIGLNSPSHNSTPDLSGPSDGAGSQTPPARRKRPRPDRSDIAAKYAPPDLRLSSLGGLRDQITQLMEIVALPLLHPELYSQTGITRPRGVLLHGVPGGGKTQLVKCLAGVSLECRQM